MNSKDKTAPYNNTRAFTPVTLNDDDRTVEAVASTDVPAMVRGWDGDMLEVLSHDPAHVDLTRMNDGAPLLDNHARHGSTMDNVIGVVESAYLSGGELLVKLRFGKSEKAETAYQGVKDGIYRKLSIGYVVHQYEVTQTAGQPDVYRAVQWAPFEVSLTPVPADNRASIRTLSDEPQPPTIDILQPAADSGINSELMKENEGVVEHATPAVADSGVTAPPAPAAQTSTPVVSEAMRTFLTAAGNAGFTAAEASKFLDGGNIAKAYEAMTASWAERAAAPVDARVTGPDASEVRTRNMMDAVVANAAGERVPENAREFGDFRFTDVAADYLERAGVATRGMTSNNLIRTAMTGTRGLHATTDFPIFLMETTKRTMRRQYDLMPQTFNPFVRRTTTNDFRPVKRSLLSGLMGNFDEIPEGGEYKAGTFNEMAETIQVKKYGKKVLLTWEALVNDDLGAFNRIATAVAQEIAQLQSDKVYAVLTGNPNLSDGTALFATARGNRAASGGVLSTTTLAAARLAMRKVKAPNDRYMNLEMRYLIAGPDSETAALQILNGMAYPQTPGDVNTFTGKFELIIEPRLGAAWWLSASPALVDTVELMFLEGNDMYLETQNDIDVDGMTMTARTVFGVAPIDWRGMYYNPGS